MALLSAAMLRPHHGIACLVLAAVAAGCVSSRATIVSTEEVTEVVNGGDLAPGTPKPDDVEALRAEILRLRTQLAATGATTAQITGKGEPAAAAPGAVTGPAAAAAAERMNSLQAELEQERTRRLAVEQELARFKAETASPLGVGHQVPESELYAVKEELVELRRTLEVERQTHQRLANGVAAIAQPAPAPSTSDMEWEARVQGLQQEKDKIVRELNQSLAASQARTKELEAGMAAKGDPAATAALSDVATAHAENTELRQRLDAEKRRTEDLEAKLQVANRLADLIFRMEQQQKKVAKPKPKPAARPAAPAGDEVVPATGTLIPAP